MKLVQKIVLIALVTMKISDFDIQISWPSVRFTRLFQGCKTRLHQQFDEHLGSLDQTFPGAPDTSDATDLYLESGGSLSGPDVVVCVWSVHRLFRLAQTSVRILNRHHTDMNHSSFHTCQTSHRHKLLELPYLSDIITGRSTRPSGQIQEIMVL